MSDSKFDSILEKEQVHVVKDGHHYRLPLYEVVPNVGIVPVVTGQIGNETASPEPMMFDLFFVRGDKTGDTTTYLKGTVHEHLLATMIHDLKLKHGEVPSDEGAKVIQHLTEAMGWMRQRQIDRITRNVQGTHQK